MLLLLREKKESEINEMICLPGYFSAVSLSSSGIRNRLPEIALCKY